MRPYSPLEPWRIVLDTAAFISAMRSPLGAASEVLRRTAARQIVVCMDHKLSFEYRDVANRREHLLAANLSPAELEDAIDTLEAYAEPVRNVKKLRPVSSDPNDDMIIELAVTSRADAIVTSNLRHLSIATSRFGIQVLTPAQLLKALGKEIERGKRLQ